ncbi:MAG TPA: DinB family protein [Terracidiphilus sp.]|nr:DinB family protein [Terracidiphilus sp.]
MHSIRRISGCVLACCLTAATTFAHAQGAASAKPAVGTAVPPAQIYGKLLSGMEQEFVGAAEAMPEDKYGFAPSTGEFKGVRTFGDQVKHVAEANYYFFGTLSDADLKAKGEAIGKLATKAEIVQALKDSFAQAHTYVDGITAENAFTMTAHGTRAGMAAFGLAHFMDHYGQMVEYLRMNGIVPPASRGGGM